MARVFAYMHEHFVQSASVTQQTEHCSGSGSQFGVVLSLLRSLVQETQTILPTLLAPVRASPSGKISHTISQKTPPQPNTCIHIHIHICEHIYIYMLYIDTYVHVYTYICIHTYIHTAHKMRYLPNKLSTYLLVHPPIYKKKGTLRPASRPESQPRVPAPRHQG